jgi:hypothetical protein
MLRYLRYLRIAFSATCLIACVLLIVLWVRSYWRFDVISIPRPQSHFEIVSYSGGIAFGKFDNPSDWSYYSFPAHRDTGDWPTFLGFARPVTPFYSQILIPYWFLTFLFAFSSATPCGSDAALAKSKNVRWRGAMAGHKVPLPLPILASESRPWWVRWPCF